MQSHLPPSRKQVEGISCPLSVATTNQTASIAVEEKEASPVDHRILQEAMDSADDGSRSTRSTTSTEDHRHTEGSSVALGDDSVGVVRAQVPEKTEKKLTVDTKVVSGDIEKGTKAQPEGRTVRKRPLPISTASEKPKARRVSSSGRRHPASTVLQQKWNRMFERLLAFKSKHGHCLVPNRFGEDPALGAWVSTQRRQYKILVSGTAESTPMTPERAAQLESVGFVWATTDPRHVPWETRFQELREYKDKFGDCLVPITFQENLKLANWVSTQRQEYKLLKQGRSSRLNPERVKALDSVGFVWAAQRGGARVRKKKKPDDGGKIGSGTSGVKGGGSQTAQTLEPHDELAPAILAPSRPIAPRDVPRGSVTSASRPPRDQHDSPVVVSVAGREDIHELLASAREGHSLIQSLTGMPSHLHGGAMAPAIATLPRRAANRGNEFSQILASAVDGQNLMSSLGLASFAGLSPTLPQPFTGPGAVLNPSLYQNILSRSIYGGLLDPMALAVPGLSSATLQALQAGNVQAAGSASSSLRHGRQISSIINQGHGVVMPGGNVASSLLSASQQQLQLLRQARSQFYNEAQAVRYAQRSDQDKRDDRVDVKDENDDDVFEDADE